MSELNNATVKMVANALAGSFYGATVQNVLASRAIGVTYTNTPWRPIIVIINASGAVNGAHDLAVHVNNDAMMQERFSNVGEWRAVVFFVPAGATYVAFGVGAKPNIGKWHEVRL